MGRATNDYFSIDSVPYGQYTIYDLRIYRIQLLSQSRFPHVILHAAKIIIRQTVEVSECGIYQYPESVLWVVSSIHGENLTLKAKAVC